MPAAPPGGGSGAEADIKSNKSPAVSKVGTIGEELKKPELDVERSISFVLNQPDKRGQCQQWTYLNDREIALGAGIKRLFRGCPPGCCRSSVLRRTDSSRHYRHDYRVGSHDRDANESRDEDSPWPESRASPFVSNIGRYGGLAVRANSGGPYSRVARIGVVGPNGDGLAPKLEEGGNGGEAASGREAVRTFF
ncbi:hypothetical protein KM043_005474 [Ampulex compressa]|nr:hypothetical protein KM043_005474 [Ampulex compressa]